MEANGVRASVDPEARNRVDKRYPSKEPLISDAVLAEIKRLSTAGCLLCAFDEWDEEDWD